MTLEIKGNARPEAAKPPLQTPAQTPPNPRSRSLIPP